MQALKRVKEFSNLARGSKAWCRARSSYAASVPCDAPKVKKTGKRMPLGERRVMVESFVNRYRGDNSGKFPTVSHAMQEVGGSYYVIKKIMQELEYNSKLLSSNAGKEVSSETEVRNSHSSSGLKSNTEIAREEELNQCIQQPLLDVSCAKKSEDAEEETHCESVSDVVSSGSKNEEHKPSHENLIPNIPENSKEETHCESVPDVDSSEIQNEEYQLSHENSIPNIPENSKEETHCESVPDVDSSEIQNEEYQLSHENSIPNIPENSKEETHCESVPDVDSSDIQNEEHQPSHENSENSKVVHQNSARESSAEQTVKKIQTNSSIWGTLKSAFISIWRKQ